jgi:putative transposase
MSKILKQFKLYGWFLGYDHFHALIQPGDEYSISEVMRSLKTNASRSINRLIRSSEGEVAPPRLRESDDMASPRLRRMERFSFGWLGSFHDHIIRDDSDFENHFGYIQFNPEKHDLPTDWPFVSENPKFIDLIDDYE